MTHSQRLIRQLRAQKKFVFVYNLDEEGIPETQYRTRLKINFEKALDAFFDSRPAIVRNENEVERY